MKLIKKGKLNYSMCDMAANLSMLGAFQMIEDANTEMMGLLRLDGETCLREYGGIWVYVRNRIELREPIHWMDEYVIECYISSIGGAKLIVDTVIKTRDKIAVASRAELCALDLQNRRVRRVGSVGVNEFIVSELPETDVQFHKSDFNRSELVDSVLIRSSDIDFNHHTNNISYVRYIVNQYSADLVKQSPITSIEIQYVNETFEGDKLDIYRCDTDDFTILCNGKSVVNCMLNA